MVTTAKKPINTGSGRVKARAWRSNGSQCGFREPLGGEWGQNQQTKCPRNRGKIY